MSSASCPTRPDAPSRRTAASRDALLTALLFAETRRGPRPLPVVASSISAVEVSTSALAAKKDSYRPQAGTVVGKRNYPLRILSRAV